MRAYTAWVIAIGRGKNVWYLADWSASGHEAPEPWVEKVGKALRFARRSDARRIIDMLALEDARPSEQTFE